MESATTVVADTTPRRTLSASKLVLTEPAEVIALKMVPAFRIAYDFIVVYSLVQKSFTIQVLSERLRDLDNQSALTFVDQTYGRVIDRWMLRASEADIVSLGHGNAREPEKARCLARENALACIMTFGRALLK